MTPEQLLKKVFPPMLATLADEAPRDEENWTYELKYDGFRAIAAIAGGKVAMWSRNELDLATRFPHIAESLRKMKVPDIVFDGEVVALDASGAPRFQLLQQGENREKLFVFDILWLDGKDLRKLSYADRRVLLEHALRRAPAGIAISQTLPPPGAAALKKAADAGWEGIIAKRNTSTYEPRRSKEWLKLKALNEQEFVVVGWQPSTHSGREIGSLHLAVREDDGAFHYAGKVGTGFSYKQRVWFRDELSKNVLPKTDVKDAPRTRDATWVRPRLVVQVAFTEWTSDHRLRHPAFLGIRDDKSPEEVVKEKPTKTGGKRKTESRKQKAESRKAKPGTGKQSTAAVSKSSGPSPRHRRGEGGRRPDEGPDKSGPSSRASRVTLTHPERVLYPRDSITKQDVADYYQAVAEPMLRALRDRPVALEHWNQGIHQPSWFHQNIGKEGGEWMTFVDTPTRTSNRSVKHLVIDSRDALQWLAQMSVLTVHMWSSRAESLDEPDWLVFDLDPAKGKGIEQAIDAAIVMRRLLENMDLESMPKTSGKRGIHVFLPLKPGYTHEEANDFACTLAAAVTSQVPGMTVERSLAKRRGRLYLDCMQNAYGKTIVAPYSLRGIDGAPVSAPLKWSEVTPKLDPSKFNLRSMPKRLDKVGDLFADVFKKKVKLPKLG